MTGAMHMPKDHRRRTAQRLDAPGRTRELLDHPSVVAVPTARSRELRRCAGARDKLQVAPIDGGELAPVLELHGPSKLGKQLSPGALDTRLVNQGGRPKKVGARQHRAPGVRRISADQRESMARVLPRMHRIDPFRIEPGERQMRMPRTDPAQCDIGLPGVSRIVEVAVLHVRAGGGGKVPAPDGHVGPQDALDGGTPLGRDNRGIVVAGYQVHAASGGRSSAERGGELGVIGERRLDRVGGALGMAGAGVGRIQIEHVAGAHYFNGVPRHAEATTGSM